MVKSKFLFRKLPLTILFLFIINSGITSQEGPATYRIRKISTEGQQSFDSKTIISNSGLKVGQEITIPSDETHDAITRLWNLNLFSDISIVVDKKVGKEADLIIKVKELPKLDNIKYSGNDEFSNKDLDEKIELVKGQVITPQTVKDIEYNLQKAYIEEGFPLAEVKVDQFINASNDAQLRVKIKEGNKISVYKISFTGNKNISSGDLKGAMDETSVRKWWKFWDKARFNRANYETDKKLIIDLYLEKGYKDAEIVSDELKYNSTKEEVRITIKVNEGEKYKVNDVSITGNKLYKDSLLLERLDMKKGDLFNGKKFEHNLKGNESQNDITALYRNNGYLGIQTEYKEEIIEGNKVNLRIKIVENKQYKIGSISLSGNHKTQDKVIRRELYTKPGLYYNQSDFIRSIRQLQSLNYFNPETMNYDFQPRNDSMVDLVYIVEEKSSDQFNASVGYSQNFGFSGSLGLTFNNFDITAPLEGGAGQILSFQWDFGSGGTYRTFQIGLTEPWLFDSPTSVGLSLFDTKQSYTYTIQETGGQIGIGRRFKFPDDYFRGDWFFKFQRTNTTQGGGIYETGIRSQFSIGQTITRNSTNSPIFPTYGSKVFFANELAGANIFGTINFLKTQFKAEAYNNLSSNDKLILATTFDFQNVSSLGKDNYVPPNELFFMGGSGLAYNTVALRGYDDRTVGPQNFIGSPLGGRVLLKYSVELRYSLIQDPIPIFLSIFSEAGNVFPSFKKANLFDLRRSVGFGARFIMPAVGVIGFDLGYGFDRRIVDRQDPSLVFHFQFGRGF